MGPTCFVISDITGFQLVVLVVKASAKRLPENCKSSQKMAKSTYFLSKVCLYCFICCEQLKQLKIPLFASGNSF